MKSREVEAILSASVKKSLGYDVVAAEKYSIVPCAKNAYLDPEYDPFQMLQFELMALAARARFVDPE